VRGRGAFACRVIQNAMSPHRIGRKDEGFGPGLLLAIQLRLVPWLGAIAQLGGPVGASFGWSRPPVCGGQMVRWGAGVVLEGSAASPSSGGVREVLACTSFGWSGADMPVSWGV